MSKFSSLPFCVKEFSHMDFVYDTYLTPYFNHVGDPNKTGFKGSLFPLALTREQVHALYWRLVSIGLSYEVTDGESNESRGYPVSEAEVPEEFLGDDLKTAILKRVCGGLSYLVYESAYYLAPPVEGTTYQTNFLSFFDYRNFQLDGETIVIPRCVKIEDAYYPFFEWSDNAYEADAATFGIETFQDFDNGATTATTYSSGPTVTLNFPDSSTASFQVFLRQIVQSQAPASGQPPRTFSTEFTAEPWNVSLW